MSFEVVVKPESLQINRSGAHAGYIWARTAGNNVPSIDWWDFPVVLLSWWSNGLVELLDEVTDSIRLDFMDGPFAIQVTRIECTVCSLELHRTRLGSKEVNALGQAELRDISGTLEHASRLVLDHCAIEKWGGTDVDSLARATRSLQGVRKRLQHLI